MESYLVAMCRPIPLRSPVQDSAVAVLRRLARHDNIKDTIRTSNNMYQTRYQPYQRRSSIAIGNSQRFDLRLVPASWNWEIDDVVTGEMHSGVMKQLERWAVATQLDPRWR
jgi:hypothetical protein